jgi:BASS family bile acid:Na+ symporter
MLATLTRLFPLWALLLSVIAYYTPSTLPRWPVGPTLLMLIMFGMGASESGRF